MRIPLALLALFLFLEGSSQTTEKVITIAPHMAFENYEHFKRLTLDSPDSHCEFLEGFTFQWGYTYKVKVDETRLAHGLSDGTQYEYTFIEVVSKEKVAEGTTFQLFIDPHLYYHTPDPSEEDANQTLRLVYYSLYSYFDEVEIFVPSFLLTDFQNILESGKGRLGTFRYVDGGRIELVEFAAR